MIEQVELRPVRVEDAEALAALYAAQRSFLAPFDPVRPDAFYTVPGQRMELEQAVAQSRADLRHRFVIVADEAIVGTLGISNIVRGRK